jgi:2-dehydropantoate 2-reductase
VRIAVMGAGAVGGYFGTRLAASSNQVVFIARGSHLTALRGNGLAVESFQGNLHLRDAVFTGDPNAVGPVDLILFASSPTIPKRWRSRWDRWWDHKP